MLSPLVVVLCLCLQVIATKTFWWDINWATANAGGSTKPVIGINGKWPPPTIEVNRGDRVIVHVTNKLVNETTGIHFHGIRQEGSNQMDGPSMITQCPIPPGNSFTYDFIVSEPGTYWYHSHNMGQYCDGLRAPFIVHDRNYPYADVIEDEYVLTLSDWYKQSHVNLLEGFSKLNHFMTPTPDASIMNDGLTTTYNIKPGKTYLFRIINMSAFMSFFVNFQNHDMTVVGLDGTISQPTAAKTLVVGAAMRYDVLVTGKVDPVSNANIIALMDTTMFEGPYTGRPLVLGTLSYGKKFAAPAPPTNLPLSIMPPSNDLNIKPFDQAPLLDPVDTRIILNFNQSIVDGFPRSTVNNVTFIPPKVPSLYTALSAPKNLRMDPRIYGENLNANPVNYNDVVEVIINNQTPLLHPWHLHGHQFQVVARSEENAVFNGQPYYPWVADPLPMRRDTIGIRKGGWVAIRFRADNPGIQLLHCHIEWHVEAGLSASILEALDYLPDLDIPWDHKQACMKAGIELKGNAAGNTKNFLDLKGANDRPMANMGALWTMGKGYPDTTKTASSSATGLGSVSNVVSNAVSTLSSYYGKLLGWLV